ncbi:uncharacterized protein [Linepithema humile]|uniref:uncharacterized protein isoform X2 n=1 Tax=Linepithema humile TaxID=83485 RepID=UPI00062372F6|nr:PREDICTED: uncharacterized protein LOC105671135 isoform X2 [Linepithema humile]
MYSLIEFPMNCGQKPEVEVVPNIWLDKKEETCYCFWPQTASTKQIRKAIEKCYLPEKNWIKYKSSYDDARKRLVNAEFTSTLETDVELHENQRSKRNIKKTFRLNSNSLDSDTDEKISCNKNKISSPPMLVTPTKNSNVLPRRSLITSKPSTSTADSSPRFSEKAVNPSQNTLRTTLTSSQFDKSDFSCLILTKLASLENSMNLLFPMVKQLVAHFRLSTIPHIESTPEMPVDTKEKLENVERFLNTKQNFEYMVNTLVISGGKTIAQITRRTLERVITNNYAKNFNWAGRPPKKAFKILKIKDLIIATVKSVEPNAAVNKIENSIKDWLKLSSVRIALAEARALKNLQRQ